jgi:hypothetical protein
MDGRIQKTLVIVIVSVFGGACLALCCTFGSLLILGKLTMPKASAKDNDGLRANGNTNDTADPKPTVATADPKPTVGVLTITKVEFRAKVMRFTLMWPRPSGERSWDGQNPSKANWSESYYSCHMYVKDFHDAFGKPIRTTVSGPSGVMMWKCTDGEVHVRWKNKLSDDTFNFIGIDER